LAGDHLALRSQLAGDCPLHVERGDGVLGLLASAGVLLGLTASCA
jgi:hypothetical protein